MTEPPNSDFNGGTSEAGGITSECPLQRDDDVEPPITIRASLFFDGTLNNRANVSIGADGAGFGENLGSYDNDISNIAILEQFRVGDTEADYFFPIYVEGIGTQSRGPDVPQGMATGRGITGVKAKVNSGIRQIISEIDALGSNKQIDWIQLDAFGFSRGAAAARYFVHAVLRESGRTLSDRLIAMGYSVASVEVNFIGLYDTVASYGLRHSNDTRDLRLDAIRHANRVVQLAAAEEHRANFRLTNIASATDGLEIFLPGVHSDVGGGYRDGADEVELQILDIDRAFGLGDEGRARLSNERQWLIESGWYHEDEILPVNFWNELRVTRRGIGNAYSRIPLHLMARYAREHNVFFSRRMAVVHAIPGELDEANVAIDEYVNGRGASGSQFGHWFWTNAEWHRRLRHDFLHFSAHYGGTNQPQFTNDDLMNGRRLRVIQDG